MTQPFQIGGAEGGISVDNPATVAGTAPTAVLDEDVGPSDEIVLQTTLPDEYGFSESELGPFAFQPSDDAGLSDELVSITADVLQTDAYGPSDVFHLEVQETAMARSGTPDNDPWGDAWVDRVLANQGVNHGNTTTLQVSAVLASSQTDGYLKINFNRLVSLSADTTSSTMSFVVDWPTVALNPNATLRVDFQTSAGSPFTESTITASNRARFSSAAPFSQRTFVFPQNGTTRTHVVTFTTAEVNDILAGKWLMVQFTVPDLTSGTFAVHARENAGAQNSYIFFVTR